MNWKNCFNLIKYTGMKSLIISLAMVCIGASSLMAQGPGTKQRQMLQERIEAQRVAFITQKLDLTADESAKFWPLYNEMKKAQAEKRSSLRPTKSFDEMSEEEAEQFIERQFTAESEIIALKRDYFTKLRDVIPAKKLAQLNRIEMEFNRGVLEKIRARQGSGPRK